MENLSHSRQPNKGIPALPKKAYNGNSYAPGKATMYDDVFGGPPRYGAPTLSPRLEDYSEIFGGFQASRASSIPVLDLPLVDEDEVFFDVRSSGFDYCEVFGGFEGLDFAVSYDELLMGQSKGGDGDSSEDAWTPAGTESLSEGSDHSGKSQCFSNGGSYESIDGCPEFNISYNEASQISNIGMPNGMTRVAGLSAVPGYTFAVDKTTSLSEEYENPHLQVTDDSSLNIDYTGGMMKGKHLRKTLSNPANHSTNGKTSADEFKQQKVYSRNSSCPREMFVSVSEISLRTRPSELPPPSRPPPVLDVKKEDPGTNSRTSAAEGSEGDSSPPYFDVEIDASSAAAVSAAAMKEAMEKAQAKIKSAKELMERKRDASHSHMKPGSRNGRKHKERIMNENVDGSCSIKDERASGSSEQVENQIKFSDQEAVPGSLEVEKTSNVARNSSEEKHVKKPWSPQGPKKVDGDDEWKEATEFFELVKTEKSRTTYERANSGEFLVLDEKYAHEHGLKEKWAAVEVLEQQQERKGKAVGEFPGVRKSEKKTEVGKEACERKDSNGRSGVATETHRQKRHDKKVKVAKDICQEEMEKKFNVAPKPVETEKKPTVADRSDKPGNLAKLKQEAKKVAAEEAMNNNDSELRLKEANKSVESPKQAKESHGREVNGNRQKQVFEWGKNEKMLREALEQAENEKRLKEVFEQKENERRKKEACEREENVMRANKVCKQREDEKRLKEAFEQEEKERRVREALLQAENERRLKEALELEENERRLKEAHDKAEIDNRLKEALELEENERRLKEAREKAEIEKRLKEALELEENGRRLKEAREKAEIERRLKEALEEAENERKLKEALEKEENERKLKKAREQAEMERRRKEALEQAENERRLTEALEKEENERKLKEACEQAEIERRLKEALEQAESERKLKQVLEKEENERKLKKACEQAEMEKRLKEALEQAENERRLTEALGKEENERRIEEALKKDKKQEVGAREREERETRLQEALKQEENDNKRKEAHERERTQNRLKEACEKQKIEKQLEEVHEQLMLKEEYEEKDNGRILKSSGREEREMELQEAFQQEGNRDRKDACAGEDTERQLKDAGDREGLKGLNKTQKSTETDENGDKLEIDEGSHLQKDKGYLRVSDDEYKLDDKETLQATQLAGKHEKISQKLEKTQEGFLKENEQIRTELKDNEKKAQAVDMGDVLIDGKYIISGMSRSNVEHEESLSRKVDVKELLHQEDRLKKAGEVGFGVGLRNLGKAKGLPVMGSNMGNHEEKFAYEWEESGKNIKQAQAALNQQENKDKFMSSSARESVETGRKIEASQSSILEGKGSSQKTAQQVTASQSTGRKEKNLKETSAPEEKESERTKRERELEKERLRKIEEEREREREREKDRMAVDRLNAETRDRTERVAVDRATAEARQRALAEAREKLEKACAEAREKTLPEKASTEARLRAERAAVERATAEARERAAEKAASEARERMERSVSDKFSASSRNNGMRLNASSSDLPDHQLQSSASFSASRFQYSSAYGASYYSERSEGAEGESAQRCKARLERHRRTAERAAKALAEKNMRDLLAQREQAERNRLAETLDADVKRWSNGKEGNLRALLSTLQYILGPDSGWQPIPLTEVITSAAVKKAYRKATLCVHPDKLQQRGANIQQKYICEKVFDLLKEAWNKFNSEER